jgi:signal transduction histidine kinase/ActR/RegA family two-component response regulator
MRLSTFIDQHKEDIVQSWEDFARTIGPPALTMDTKGLRDHASLILDTIVADLNTAQTPREQSEKSWGVAPKTDSPSHAKTHAAARLASGYTVIQLISEFRAVRASVLRLWAANSPAVMWSDADDVTRFNEAVDQALAESVMHYSSLVESTIEVQKNAEVELRLSHQHKDEFLAMLAHELRNPLAPISAAAHLLSMSLGDEIVVQQASATISRQISHLNHIVDDLLDVSRITRGLVELNTEPLDVKLVINSAIEQSQALIEACRHQLILELGSTPAFVEGDKTRLVQVLSNLLNNAAKYTPHNGKIVLSLEAREGQAHLTVSDNGCGIAPHLMPHIFELFAQADRTIDRAQGGLGLGLSLVKKIITLHGGQVKAESEGPGKGSVFTVQLPLLTKPSEVKATNRLEALRPTALAVQDGERMRLMIVDDNRDAGQSLAMVLRAKGYRATVHESARGALHDAGLAGIQVFILDIGMPGLDGYALARRLRTDPATQQAVLIAVTGYGRKHDRAMGEAAGFDHYFVKPVDLRQLAEVLANIHHRI